MPRKSPEAQSVQPPIEPEGTGITRRKLLTAGVLGAVGYALSKYDIEPSAEGGGGEESLLTQTPPANDINKPVSETREIGREESLERVRQALRASYPAELIINFLPLANQPEIFTDDKNVTEYFLLANLEELIADGIITENNANRLLNPCTAGGMWDDKIRMASETNAELCIQAYARARIWQRDNSDTVFTADEYQTAWQTALDSAWRISQNRGLYSLTKEKFGNYIQTRALLALSVKEVGPHCDNPLAEIALYRAMLDRGFHPNIIPSTHDHIFSMGPLQIRTQGYEGGHRDGSPYGVGEPLEARLNRELGSIAHIRGDAGLPERFYQCVELSDHLLAGALFTINNASFIFEDLENNIVFQNLWNASEDETEKERTLCALIAAYHHSPAEARAHLSIGGARDLAEWRKQYISGLSNENLRNYITGTDKIFDTFRSIQFFSHKG